jgi:hypothetical protein
MPDNAFNDGYNAMVTALGNATGLTIADDPRNINPPGILVQAPTITMHSNNVAEFEFMVTVIGTGPGNKNALTKLLEIADKVREGKIGLKSARPIVQQVGGAEFPAYELVIVTKVQAAA